MAPVVMSAGLLLYRRTSDGVGIEVLLGHMGGPYWARKDEGAWSMPKGEYLEGEAPLAAAKREFAEELGSPPPPAEFRELGSIRQSGGKTVTAWAADADFDATTLVSGTFDMEWPPRSGRMQSFPEIDRAQWFRLAEAAAKLVKGQRPFLARLSVVVGLDQAPGR
jgi:predicted NUDIX family NTP pyrophosphohydrolase